MYLGHKHVKTRPSCSHELATFLKYHMPLRSLIKQCAMIVCICKSRISSLNFKELFFLCPKFRLLSTRIFKYAEKRPNRGMYTIFGSGQ